ncbi:MAG: hypothetical protein HWE07_00700 [Cytophagia bacterium]|nr:hypothetical protein [Cytophagia bacterium]
MNLNFTPREVKSSVYITIIMTGAVFNYRVMTAAELQEVIKLIAPLAVVGWFEFGTRMTLIVLFTTDSMFRRMVLGNNDIYGFWADCVMDTKGNVLWVCVSQVKFLHRHPYIRMETTRYDINARYVENRVFERWEYVSDLHFKFENGLIIFGGTAETPNTYSIKYKEGKEQYICRGLKITGKRRLSLLKERKSRGKAEKDLIKVMLRLFEMKK